nr:Retrovirus-related Pol polyprotein from transposon TNT 1-94 [Ipomoea batatas]
MKEGESATEYMGRLMTVVNQLRTNGDKTTDVTVVDKILRSMTSKYDFVVCAIEEANDIDKMTLDELESSLRVHEKKFIRQANEGSFGTGQQVLVNLGDEVDKEEAKNVQPVPNQDITEQGKNTSSTHETNDGRPQRNKKRP